MSHSSFFQKKKFRPIVRDDIPTLWMHRVLLCFRLFFRLSSVFVAKTFWASDHLQIPITINCLKHVLSVSYNATATWTIQWPMTASEHWNFWMALETNEPNLYSNRWIIGFMECSNEWCAKWGAYIICFGYFSIFFSSGFKLKKEDFGLRTPNTTMLADFGFSTKKISFGWIDDISEI